MAVKNKYKYWPDQIEIPDYPVQHFLEESARKFPDNDYMVFLGKGTTFAEVNNMANKFANALQDLGVKLGDKVALFMPNLPHFPIAFFGVCKAGAVNITCNPIYTDKELAHQINDSGAKTLVVLDHPTLHPTAMKAIEISPIDNVIVCSVKDFLSPVKGFIGGLIGKVPKSPEPIAKDHHKFADIMKKYPAEAPKVSIDTKNGLGLILYTGGTTGTPKGAMLTHRNFVANVLQLTEVMWPKVDFGNECYLGGLPWYHSYGLTTCLLSAAYHGAKVICIPDPRAGNPPFTDILEAINEFKPTYFHAVPTLYGALTNHPKIKDYDLSSIKACASGAAPLPKQVMVDFEAVSGGNVVEGYGLTETSPVASVNPLKEGKKLGSIGLPVSNTEMKVFDLDTGNELGVGETGEIAIKGPQVMKGYYNRPEETAEVIDSNGFFRTGDIGHFDEEGFFFITDRKKDMIIVGGYKVYPRDVEEILFEHTKIANAAVIGVPDSHSGEKVKAFVVFKPGEQATEQELIKFCAKKLAAYKVPKSIEVRDELPQTMVGKVLRRKLRE
ncbi:MAG: Long-chain-fatty-acid--CoA ligase [Candidatus Heimdallarchaeota archaeon LC_3]|nr:MAG: Long-chain-fatty-acid--CoA ligase [Candidatus Heimdallarchaeota archaeon LC_3]